MKKYLILLQLLACAMLVEGQIVFHDAAAFPLLGKATEYSATRYERLPDSLKNICRKPLWELGQNSAGLAVRFRSNSTTIAAKWEARFNVYLNHMTVTGVRGLDLYCLQNGKWTFVNTARPLEKVSSATISSNMKPEEREYMLYLPLYDGLVSLSIGVDSLSHISQPAVDSPVRLKPVVFYGTSILQGGCASRPGMAHSNILSRWLNRETINLGFSGNALLDYEIADVAAGVDASMYVLDFVPNATVAQMKKHAGEFYRRIRSRHPDTPILLVEDPIFPCSKFDQRMAEEVKQKNETINTFYQSLKKSGEKNVYLLSSKEMIGQDGEATIDGLHFTDLGFMRYSELLYPIIKKYAK